MRRKHAFCLLKVGRQVGHCVGFFRNKIGYFIRVAGQFRAECLVRAHGNFRHELQPNPDALPGHGAVRRPHTHARVHNEREAVLPLVGDVLEERQHVIE